MHKRLGLRFKMFDIERQDKGTTHTVSYSSESSWVPNNKGTLIYDIVQMRDQVPIFPFFWRSLVRHTGNLDSKETIHFAQLVYVIRQAGKRTWLCVTKAEGSKSALEACRSH